MNKIAIGKKVRKIKSPKSWVKICSGGKRCISDCEPSRCWHCFRWDFQQCSYRCDIFWLPSFRLRRGIWRIVNADSSWNTWAKIRSNSNSALYWAWQVWAFCGRRNGELNSLSTFQAVELNLPFIGSPCPESQIPAVHTKAFKVQLGKEYADSN